MKSLFVITATALITCAAAPALAQTESPAPEVRVGYVDLDLTRPAGRAALEQRVSAAINLVCPQLTTPFVLPEQSRRAECRRAAWASAKRQLERLYAQNKMDGAFELATRAK